jgi:hypothetical protein
MLVMLDRIEESYALPSASLAVRFLKWNSLYHLCIPARKLQAPFYPQSAYIEDIDTVRGVSHLPAADPFQLWIGVSP